MDNTLKLEKLQMDSQALLRDLQQAKSPRKKSVQKNYSGPECPLVRVGECLFEFVKQLKKKSGSACGLYRCSHCGKERNFAYIPRRSKAA